VADVLRSLGYYSIIHANDGKELLELTVEYEPRIVITTSRLPELSGLEYTRLIRSGYKNVSRLLSIIVMTDTPTRTFLDAAQASGVDEMLVRPFTAQAMQVRIKAVMERPRPFIDSAVYLGPCRRRRMIEDYVGPLRRFIDPTDDMPERLALGAGTKSRRRAQVRHAHKRTVVWPDGWRPPQAARHLLGHQGNRGHGRRNQGHSMLGAAARSLGRYITAIGANGTAGP
jgi:DNA-binding response OmpR family regulator